MPAIKTVQLGSAPRQMRSGIIKGLMATPGGAIDRTGGDYDAGIIRGFSVVTRGEAIGHGLWLDSAFLNGIQLALSSGDGFRVRFTHPTMSSDGLGRKLGRVKFSSRAGDIVRGDLHFSQASHSTPDGDLASYVMGLAEEDPDLFGASIVFEHDIEEEEAFIVDHGGRSRFKSPDPDNKRNLPHARLSELRAVDVVDEPAANPHGMFHATPVPAEADALAEYVVGLSDKTPACGVLAGIDVDRLRGFVSRFLNRRGIEIQKETAMQATPAKGPKAMSDSKKQREAVVSKYKSFTKAMGADRGLNWFSSGVSLDAAMRLDKTAFGGRLMKFDAADELNAHEAAGVFWMDAAQLGTWVSVGGIPEPDRTEKHFSYWRVSSLAQWAADGCPSRNGRKSPEMLAMIGADKPETPREKSNIEKFAAGIKVPGESHKVPIDEIDKAHLTGEHYVSGKSMLRSAK